MRSFVLLRTFSFKKLKALILAGFLVLSMSVFGQYSISGKVTDVYNNPISSANIFIRGIEKGVTSNSDGKFKFSNLPKGVFTLTCSHESFLSNVQIIQLESTPMTIFIKMKTTAKSMEEIILTSAGNEPLYHSTHTSNSLSHAELQKSGQNTLMESISQKPGMDIISTGGIGKPEIGRAHV